MARKYKSTQNTSEIGGGGYLKNWAAFGHRRGHNVLVTAYFVHHHHCIVVRNNGDPPKLACLLLRLVMLAHVYGGSVVVRIGDILFLGASLNVE